MTKLTKAEKAAVAAHNANRGYPDLSKADLKTAQDAGYAAWGLSWEKAGAHIREAVKGRPHPGATVEACLVYASMAADNGEDPEEGPYYPYYVDPSDMWECFEDIYHAVTKRKPSVKKLWPEVSIYADSHNEVAKEEWEVKKHTFVMSADGCRAVAPDGSEYCFDHAVERGIPCAVEAEKAKGEKHRKAVKANQDALRGQSTHQFG